MQRGKRFVWACVCSLTVALSFSSDAANKAPQNFDDPDLHLLVDDAEVHRTTNLQRVINRVKKLPEPVLVADKPWEGDRVQAWGSVIQETNGLLRMWYLALNTERKTNEMDRGGYCYAESRDGLHWTKPDLGVVEFRGSTSNNLFYSFAPDSKNLVDEELARRGLGLPALDESGKEIGVLNNADGITVVRDDSEADPQKRYKLIANMQDHRMWSRSYPGKYPNVTGEEIRQAQKLWGHYMDTSPDGIHWTRKPRRIVSPVVGDYALVTRDYRNQRWWLNERAKGKTPRNVALRTSKDLLTWTEAKVTFETDPQSEGEERFFEWHGGITPFNYGNVNLGFLEKWCNGGFGNSCELVMSRDGAGWQRVAMDKAFLDISPEGAFDHLLAYPTHNPPVRIGEDLFIYYTGGGATVGHERGMPMAIGVAKIRLDRFAGLAHSRGTDPGEFITNPFKLTRSQLELNIEPLDRTQVRVALGDEKGQPIAGFGYGDSQVEVTPEKLYSRVSWKGKTLAELNQKFITLHVEIRGAIIYSFRLID
ncbi:MAG: hypothetical protein JWM68_3532 [Verrucomicrobiales bacterium]|nr:hypothetical protein [Verrucomicrobiales bacterium]